MSRRRLPIDIQTFREIREQGCYYADKTPYIRRLLDRGKHYFLSRPPGFGKSLFLDTCKELFEGNEPLFEGLHIHDHWDWAVRHPVVRLSFSSGSYGHYRGPEDARTELSAQLSVIEDEAEIAPDSIEPSFRLRRLLKELHERTGQRVAILVDEYEKPVLDNLDTPETARAIRDYLFGFYATIKSSDADICFSLVAGVHKFPLAGPFSGLNNLMDLTLDPRYAAICGFTDADLDAVFAPELPGLDRDEIRAWYSGYNWSGDEKVYNPFDILRLFDKREFGARRFETDTPAFLVEALLGVRAADLEDMMANPSSLLSTFDVEHMTTEALLFQAGYITITEERKLGHSLFFGLGCPNRAARKRLDRALRT